jgi:hypothetical protein
MTITRAKAKSGPATKISGTPRPSSLPGRGARKKVTPTRVRGKSSSVRDTHRKGTEHSPSAKAVAFSEPVAEPPQPAKMDRALLVPVHAPDGIQVNVYKVALFAHVHPVAPAVLDRYVLLQTFLSKVSLRSLVSRLAVLSGTTTTEVERAINEALGVRKPTTDARRNLLATCIYVLCEDFAGVDHIPARNLAEHGVITTVETLSPMVSLEDALARVQKAITLGDPAVAGSFLSNSKKLGGKHVKQGGKTSKSGHESAADDTDEPSADEAPQLIPSSSSEEFDSEAEEAQATPVASIRNRQKRKRQARDIATAVAAAVGAMAASQSIQLQGNPGKSDSASTPLSSYARAAPDGHSWQAPNLDTGSGAGVRTMNRNLMVQNGSIGSDGFADPDSYTDLQKFLPSKYHTAVTEQGKIGIDFSLVALLAALDRKISISGAEFEVKSSASKVKLNWQTWDSVFEMYKVSFVSAVPTFGPNLTNYRKMIQSFVYNYGLEPALRYDSLFRKQAESHYLSSQVLMNFKKSDVLFSTVFHGIAAARCSLCSSRDHDTVDHLDTEQPQQPSNYGGSRAPCPVWNRGDSCNKWTCKLTHKCSGCGSGQFAFHNCFRCNPPADGDRQTKKGKRSGKGGKP